MKELSIYIKESILDPEEELINRENHFDVFTRIIMDYIKDVSTKDYQLTRHNDTVDVLNHKDVTAYGYVIDRPNSRPYEGGYIGIAKIEGYTCYVYRFGTNRTQQITVSDSFAEKQLKTILRAMHFVY